MILALENILWRAHVFTLELNVRLTGPIVGLFGASGAGKTSVLNLIAGIETPLNGTIRFNNVVLTAVPNGPGRGGDKAGAGGRSGAPDESSGAADPDSAAADRSRAGEPDSRTGDRPGADPDSAAADRSRAGEPDSRAGDPDSRAGEPDSRAGEPDSRAGEPDSRAGEPDSRAGDRPAADPDSRAAQGELTSAKSRPTGWSVPARRRRIGYVAQDRALFPHLSVRDNVLYGAGAPAGEPFTLEHVTDLLEIGSLLDRKPGRLSGGEQQRVAIARALLSRPALLLLDEPLSGLDENLKEKTLGLLNRLEAEFRIPMIYVSHSAAEVSAICDEVVVLDQGRLIAQGGPADVFEQTLSPQLRVRAKFPARGIQA